MAKEVATTEPVIIPESETDNRNLENPEPKVDREVQGSSQGTSDVASVVAVQGPEVPDVDPDVQAALEEAAKKGELGGIAPLNVQEAEVEHADEAYNLEEPGAGVADTTVVADLEARKELAAASHREVENDELQSLAIGEDTEHEFIPVDVPFVNSIRKDERVQVVVRERTEDDANDFGIESTEQERIVKDLAESGQLFDKGGPLVNWTGDPKDLSDGVDGLFLAERSKQTGTKLF